MNGSPIELTTAATDAVIALLCFGIVIGLNRFRRRDAWKTSLWSWVFILLAVASGLGAVAHGFDLSDSVRAALWVPLYLLLGLTVALFLVGAVDDGVGRGFARTLIPWAIGLGTGFWLLTQVLSGAFIVFVLYETVAMVGALALYSRLAVKGGLPGAGIVAAGIGLNLIAAVVQASDISFWFIFPFDHNGVFHLVQMVALVTLGHGLRLGLETATTSPE